MDCARRPDPGVHSNRRTERHQSPKNLKLTDESENHLPSDWLPSNLQKRTPLIQDPPTSFQGRRAVALKTDQHRIHQALEHEAEGRHSTDEIHESDVFVSDAEDSGAQGHSLAVRVFLHVQTRRRDQEVPVLSLINSEENLVPGHLSAHRPGKELAAPDFT